MLQCFERRGFVRTEAYDTSESAALREEADDGTLDDLLASEDELADCASIDDCVAVAGRLKADKVFNDAFMVVEEASDVRRVVLQKKLQMLSLFFGRILLRHSCMQYSCCAWIVACPKTC